jgi:hypothetical protein
MRYATGWLWKHIQEPNYMMIPVILLEKRVLSYYKING